MGLVSGIVVYFLIWWTALFCILPIGIRPDATGAETTGGWRGAPVGFSLWHKLAGTTLLATLLWLVVYWLSNQEWASFRDGWLAIPTR
jgi:predicted secreted protein